MKQILAVLVMTILCALSPKGYSKDFEGKVEMKIISEGKTSFIAYTIKGAKMKITGIKDAKGKPVSKGNLSLFDMKEKKMYIIMADQKMYMESSLTNSDSGDNKEKKGSFKKGSKTETILNKTCEEYIYTFESDSKYSTSEMYMAKGIGIFPNFRKANPTFPAFDLKEDLFPLKIITYDKAGKVSTTVEITSLDTSPVSDQEVSLPDGYQKFEMPGFDMSKYMK